ncbi:MAG: choice-of-anchor Q domain-containing protein [Chloroflexales bacterium]|jgi:CSLREA domain-containing protein
MSHRISLIVFPLVARRISVYFSAFVCSANLLRYFVVIVLLLAMMGVVPTAHAANLTVDTLIDENDNSCSDGDCSLRDAITVATTGDTITFATGLAGQTITLGSQLAIAKDLTIDGSSLAPQVRVSGNDAVRVLYISSGIVVLRGLQIINGKTLTGGTLCPTYCGGGIYVDTNGTLTVSDSTFSGNTASYRGGGITNVGSLTVTGSTFNGNRSSLGGGIRNYGKLTVTGSTFSGNVATNSGGGMYNTGTLTVTGSTVNGNSADAGAGFYNADSMILSSSIISGNTSYYGSGIYNTSTITVTDSSFSKNSATDGGGIYNTGSLTMTVATFSGNVATNSGGGMYNTGTLTATGLTLSNNWAFDGTTLGTGGGVQNTSGNVRLTNCAISRGAALHGAGIYNASTMTLTGCTLNANDASLGGGVYNDSTGVLTTTNSTFSRNTADSGGGGILNTGTLTATNITLNGNSASNGSTIGTGGGFQNNGGTATFTNCTISNNQAEGTAEDGGGGMMVYVGTANLVNCTIADNSTTSEGNTGYGGGGISASSGATVSLQNTLVAGNTSTANKPDLSGAITSNGHNLIGRVDGSTGITHGTNGDIAGNNAEPVVARLAILADYQGTTYTHALLPGSPAIDAGANCAATDQRGIARPQGSACDIGAFESRGFTLALTSGDNQRTRTGTAFAAPLVVTVAAKGAGEPVGPGGIVTFSGMNTGASITSTTVTTTTNTSGQASIAVTANTTSGGPYAVVAMTLGVIDPVTFSLTNAIPTIEVLGAGRVIARGDTIPSSIDDTDFGGIFVAGSVTHTFTISNNGTGDLNLSGNPRVVFSGAAVSDFTVVQQPTSPISPGGSVTFQVRFTPSTTGQRGATISIINDDSAKNPYTFAIQGKGVFTTYLPLIRK